MPFTWSNIWPGGEPFYTPAQTTNTQIGNPTTGYHLLHPDAAKRQYEKNIAMQNLMKENPDQLGTITNTGQVNKMSMFSPNFWTGVGSLGGIGDMAKNKYKNWMGNYNLANESDLDLSNYITLDGTTPVINEGQLLADTTEQAPVVYPGSLYSPHRGFEEMQFDETVQAPEKKGFKFPSVLGTVKGGLEFLGDKLGMTQVSAADRAANKQFMQEQGIYRDPQTGRMIGGDFAGKNAPGTSGWGSANFGEMAQKWDEEYGDMQYKTQKMRNKQARMKQRAADFAMQQEAQQQERIRNEGQPGGTGDVYEQHGWTPPTYHDDSFTSPRDSESAFGGDFSGAGPSRHARGGRVSYFDGGIARLL
jgi:hypothetical protein